MRVLTSIVVAFLFAGAAQAATAPPGAATSATAKVPAEWAFPAPLKGKPPAEVWLPRAMSDEEKQHRVEADRALIAAVFIDANELQNARALQDELKTADYDDLEAQLGAVLEKFLADPTYEVACEAAARFAEQGHVSGRPSDTALLDAWLQARPDSAWAHFSRGQRWHNDAWGVRGTGWGSDVSQEQWKLMHEDEIKARAEIETAVKIQPKLAVAWATLLDIDRLDGGLNKSSADYVRASKAVPTSFSIPDSYEETLEPRWMGNDGMMIEFARSKLADLKQNPRFWYLYGDAAADAGCAACDHYQWDVSLQLYNLALVYADRVSWLEKAGQAALHLHRYALAYAYYQRADSVLHMLPGDRVPMQPDAHMLGAFAAERCDPSKTEAEVEKDRQEIATFGGLDNVAYPLGPHACEAYERELPWGDQALPDAVGVQVYTITALTDPVFTKQPMALTLGKSVTSADGKYVLTIVQGDDKVSRVQLHDQKTGWQADILSSTGPIYAGFNSTGKRVFASDTTKGEKGGCRYYDPKFMRSTDLKPKVLQWAKYQHIAVTVDSAMVNCFQFINDDVLSASLTGVDPDGKKVFMMLAFDPDSGKLASTTHSP